MTPPPTNLTRVAFTFDPPSLRALQDFQEIGGYVNLAGAIRDALLIARGLQSQATQGYSEVRVRNPRSGRERIAVIPNLVAEAEK